MSAFYCVLVEGGMLSPAGIDGLLKAAGHMLRYRHQNVEIVDNKMQPRFTVRTDFSEQAIDIIHGTLFKAEIIEDGKRVRAEFIVQTSGPEPGAYKRGWELYVMVSKLLANDPARN